MTALKENDGFTLIEVLVGISLSFFVISIIITFFLLVAKITSASTKQFAEKKEIILFIDKLNGFLRKSADFEIEIMKDNLVISSGEGKIIADSKWITINKVFSLDSNVVYYLELTDKRLGKLVMMTGKDIALNAPPGHKTFFSSEEVESIYFKINKNNKKYELLYHNPAVSSKRFVNLTE